MTEALAKVRHWWGTWKRGRSVVPFEVACGCGGVVTGQRRVRAQVVRCDQCSRDVFVLPLSPLPPVPALNDAARPQPAAAPAGRRATRPWLVAAALVLVVAVAVPVVLLRNRSGPVDGSAPTSAGDELAQLRLRLDQGRKALAAGNFQQAAAKLQEAQALREPVAHLLRPAEGREVTDLYLQAALLADLVRESLGEMLDDAAAAEEQEWQARFTRHYQGRAVVFDAEVRRDASGQLHLGYRVGAGREAARLELAGLKVLDNLPLDAPTRLLFGCRLASIHREPPGIWVVRFDPDSGVLLTDPNGAAAACFYAPEQEIQQITQRQKAWAGGLDAR